MKIKLVFQIFMAFSVNTALANSLSCNSVFNDLEIIDFSNNLRILVEKDLTQIQNENQTKLSSEQIQKLNQEALNSLDKLPAAYDEKFLKSLSTIEAQDFITKINSNSVTGNDRLYQRAETNIGYCFGRATFVHLEALKQGYKKEQIKKIWAVGTMTNFITWHFHVATVVRNGAKNWVVIDNFVGHPVSPTEWFEQMKKFNNDGTLQLFVTDAEKFTPALGRYTRAQLGLDLGKNIDWYKHYFKDLMKTWADKKDE